MVSQNLDISLSNLVIELARIKISDDSFDKISIRSLGVQKETEI